MPETPDPLDEFPRQVARTRGFSLGIPRAFTVSPDGERVVFLRTTVGDDPASCLWVLDVAIGVARPGVGPRAHGSRGAASSSQAPAGRDAGRRRDPPPVRCPDRRSYRRRVGRGRLPVPRALPLERGRTPAPRGG